MALITEKHIDQYEQEGCVHIPGVFSDSETASLTKALLHSYDIFDSPQFRENKSDAVHQNPPTVHPGDGQVQLRNFAQHVTEVRNWLYESAAGEVIGTLMRASHVRYWSDATFIKEGASNDSATPWHNDECTFPFQGKMMPSFWVALTDVPIENAPITTLVGSNKDTFRYHSPMSRQDVEVEGFKPWSHLLARVNDPDANIKTWLCNKGDILLIHPRTIHASLPRSANYPGQRIAFTTRWLGSDTYWDPNPLSFEIKALHNTDIMQQGAPPPDEYFPIVWHKDQNS